MISKLAFLDLYSSNNTVHSYRTSIKKFLINVYKKDFSPTELEKYAERYINENRSVETIQQNVEDFFVTIKMKPPKSILATLSAINKFLYKNKVKIDSEFWTDLRGKIRGRKALTKVAIPTKEELKNILMHLDLRSKTMVLMLSSSGMRIGELMTLRLGDVDLTKEPVKVSISGTNTKNGESRITFISSEAKPLLEQYLKERDSLYKLAQKRAKSFVKGGGGGDDRLFPFSDHPLSESWASALRKTDLAVKDVSTNRTLYHIHVLRKFFRSNFGNPDVAEVLMGHSGYLTDEYRFFDEHKLAEDYLKCESNLWVLSNGEETEKLKRQLGEKSEQLQTILNSVVAENVNLKDRLAKAEMKIDEIVKMVSGRIESSPSVEVKALS